MRFQDFLADHFGMQYAVPRTNGRKPERSRWSEYGEVFLDVAGKVALGMAVFLMVCVALFRVKRGEIPVAVILVAALLSCLSGICVTFMV